MPVFFPLPHIRGILRRDPAVDMIAVPQCG
jgi:hypothetical protein